MYSKISALVLLFALVCNILVAQTYQVGNGTISNAGVYPAPYGNLYWGARHQFLITAAELNAVGAGNGNITALGFDVINASNGLPLTDFEIKIGTTAVNDLTTWESGLTSVYINPSYVDVVGINTHTFTTPFYWDGVSNIVVETCFNNSDWNSNADFNQTATSFNSTIYFRQDAAGVCANTGISGTVAQRPNMYFDITAGGPCIDPPTAGVTIANINPVCASELLVLSLQGQSTGSGQTYQWQDSPDGVNWSPIIGATNVSYSTNQTVTTYYRCLVTCGASSVPSDFVMVTSNPPTQCYCDASITFVPFDEYISDVQVAGITNPSGGTPGGYVDYTSIVIPMSIGTDHPITVLNGLAPDFYAGDQCGIWVDWNQDGDFYDANEAMTVLGNPSPGPYTSIINPPVGTPLGQTRMRVRLTWTGLVDPCGITTYGEIEDYTIDVQPAPTCPFATAIAFSNITINSADVDWADGPTAVGYEIRWKAVTDLPTVSTWATPTATLTSNYSIPGLLPNTIYEVQINTDCGGGDLSGFTFSYNFQTSCGLTVCPVGAFTENENCGDDVNGGCNMTVPNYEPIACGQTVCGTAWSSAATRDTDWYTFTLTQPSTVTWTVDADFPAIIGYVDASAGCAAPQFFNLAQNAGECSGTSSVQNLAAGTWWLFVAHSTFDDAYGCTSGKTKYVGTLSCVPLAVAANDECSGAISLVQDLNCNPTTANVDNATQSLTSCAAGGTANDDVWFSFVATNTTAQVIVAGSASFDAVVQVFDACAGTSLACVDATLAGATETATVTGLTIGNTYYVRVYDYEIGMPATTNFDICVVDPGNIIIMNNNNDETTCSAQFYDSGAAGAPYQNNETFTKTIYPDTPNSLLQVVFNSFDTENNYDGLLIYNGPNTASPLIASGLPAGFNAVTCPANSWYGTNSPGTVTSSDPTGALTFVWASDISGTPAGWDATVSCISALDPPQCATNIQPVDLSVGVNPNPILTWSQGAGTPPTGYDVYFGTVPNPPLVSANQPGTSYSPGLLSFGTMYYWSVVPVNGNGTATGCTEQSFETGTSVVYCNPTSTFCEEFISNVVVGNINNPSACTAGGYQDYTTISTDVYQGLTYPITITNGPPTYAADQCGIWVDWNQDGDFIDANESVTVIGTPGNGPYTANIDVPTTANLGSTRIRVRITFTGIVDPCGNTTYGETEDYLFNVLPEPFCAYPGGLNVTNLTPTDAQLNWNNITGAVNYFVRYKDVNDPGTAPTWVTPTVVAAPTNFLAISGLTPNTTYEFQIQTDCGSTPFGFSPSSTFLTPCGNTICPVNAIQEGEVCGTDVNGGCNMTTPFYTPIECGDTICGTAWADGGTRDTDWFTFTLTQPSTVTWTVDAEFPMVIGFVDASQGCAAPQFFNLSTTTGLCGNTFSIDNLAAGTWWTFIAPNGFAGFPCGTSNNYVASLNCVPLTVAANDECSGALPAVWNTTCNPVTGTVDNATQSLVGCSGTANDDVWYSFVATNTTGVIEVAGSASFDPVIEVFDACAGTSLFCFDANFGPGTIESGIMTGLTIGNTYYVRIYDAELGIPATTSFTLCIYDIPPPPVNDDCSGAIAMVCNTPVSGSTAFATADPTAAFCGTSVTSPGVWYTVMGNGGLITASLCTGTGYDSKINVYSGDCSNLICEGGNDDFCGLQSEYSWTGVAGTMYYILVQGYNNAVGNFTLTVTTPLAAPVITASGNTTLCSGATVDLSSDLATGNVWTTNETTQTITVGTTGDYSSTITDGNGCSATSNIISVTTSAPPTPVITSSGSTVCEGNTVTLSINWTGDITWSPTFEFNDTVQVSVVGTYDYSVTITDALGCTAQSAIEVVTINPTPVAQISANGPTTVCGNGSVDLTASGGDSYLWNDGITTTPVITVSTAGDYYSVVSNTFGCSDTTSTITVGIFPAPTTPTITASGATTFCDGGTVTLTSSQANAYDWGSGNTNQDLVVTTSGLYTVTTTDINGCTAVSAPEVVTVNPNPIVTVTANGPTTFCLGGTVDLTSSAATGNVWTNSQTAQTISVSTSGTYSTTVTDANGCSGVSNAVAVTVNSVPVPTITANGSLSLCNGATVDLTSSSSTDNLWSTGSTNQTITVSTAASITVTVTDTATGCSATSLPTVTTVGAGTTPYIIVGGPTIICEGETVQLLSSEASGNTWSSGETTNSILVGTTGLYTVTYTSPGGCTAVSTTVPVLVNPDPTPSFTANPTLGGFTQFTNTSADYLTSQWDFGDGSPWSNADSPSHTYTGDGTFTVTLTVGNGCGTETITQTIQIVGTGIESLADGTSLELYPNPTSDVINLAFNGSKTQNLTVRVVNVGGQLVYADAVGQYTGQYRNVIDLSTVAKGVYFVQLITDQGTINRKVVLH
ncbi:MAG TPA: GEVED domain-containing protein [Bacteroidia bacterium]|nr:GEVED domain-containing protein [Bacteroidia bacterium]